MTYLDRKILEPMERKWLNMKPWERRALRVLISMILSLFFFVGPLFLFVEKERYPLLYLTYLLLGSGVLYSMSLLLTAIAKNRAALVLKNAQLKELSLRDSLTRLYSNRDFMNDMIKMMIAHARRNKSFFYLLFVDIDDLGAINNTYGHVAGDSAIIATAETFNASVRVENYVFRYGGDEFLGLVCIDVKTKEQAEKVVREVIGRLSRKTEDVRIYGTNKDKPDASERIPFSVSVGAHLVNIDNNFKAEMEEASKQMKSIKEENKRKRKESLKQATK